MWLVLLCLAVIGHSQPQTIQKENINTKSSQYMDKITKNTECSESDQSNDGIIYTSSISLQISNQMTYTLNIIEYELLIIFELINDNNFIKYTNISTSTLNNLYQLYSSKEFINVIEASTNDSISQITHNLREHSNEMLLFTVYIRYEVLNREINLYFNKKVISNTMNVINILINKYNQEKKRINSIVSKMNELKNENIELKNKIQKLINLPYGAIIMFHGDINDIPIGFILCDGKHGSPDLRDKFIIGGGNKYTVGDKGGNVYHTHNVDMLEYTINTEATEVRTGNGKHRHHHKHHHHHHGHKKTINTIYEENNVHKHDATVEQAAYLPPFYAAIFIMKVE